MVEGGALPLLSSDPQQNLDVRNPLLVSWQNPILKEAVYLPLFRADGTGMDVCSLSARGGAPPLKGKNSADRSGHLCVGLRSGKSQAGLLPPPESQGHRSPCAEGAGSSPEAQEPEQGRERCAWGVGSRPGQTWLEMSPEALYRIHLQFLCFGTITLEK